VNWTATAGVKAGLGVGVVFIEKHFGPIVGFICFVPVVHRSLLLRTVVVRIEALRWFISGERLLSVWFNINRTSEGTIR
jgi:hypothetical protein